MIGLRLRAVESPPSEFVQRDVDFIFWIRIDGALGDREFDCNYFILVFDNSS